MSKYVMALDQGTTSSRCIIFDRQGKIISLAQKEFNQIFPKPGWVEHDPLEIWSSQLSVAIEAMGKEGIQVEEIAALGITNQRETTICWEKATGKPIYNGIVWQCRRTSGMTDELKNKGYEEMIREKTGLIPDAYFSASKISWILDHIKGARERAEKGEILFGTVDTWLIWNLSRGKIFATDYSNASRTMIFNIHTLEWDEEILNYFRIPRAMLPEVHPSSFLFGYTDASVIGGEIPIGGAAGDQQAALFGQCCFEEGEAKNTYGTGCFLLMNTGTERIRSKNGLLTTIAANTGESVQYALEGSVFVAGAAIQWLRDEMGLIEKASESELLAEKAKSTGGVYVVPAFTGLGAPYWNPYARGMILGLTRGTGKNEIIRATLESMAFQTWEVLEAMEKDSKIQLRELKVDGGASSNNFLMQFQADILSAAVVRPDCIETTAQGAAYLAGLAVGFFKNKEEIKKLWKKNKEFQPKMLLSEQEIKRNGWKKAVACASFYADENKPQGMA